MRVKQDHSRERELRRNQTRAEGLLWMRLRDRRLAGFKFRRQHRIGPYFADFVCADAALIVEVDGSQHLDAAEYDETRTRVLEAAGYRVVRVWNDDVLRDMPVVLDEILRVLRTPHPGSLREPVPLPAARGEGGT